MCSASSFSVATHISAKNAFNFCPSFNLKAFQRQQLDEIWPYLEASISCLYLNTPISSVSNSSCSKVYLNVTNWQCGSCNPPSVWKTSMSSSQCPTSVYQVWSWLGNLRSSLAPSHSNASKMYLAYVGGYCLMFAMVNLPNQSPVSCCNAILSSLHHRRYVNIVSNTSWYTVSKFILQ